MSSESINEPSTSSTEVFLSVVSVLVGLAGIYLNLVSALIAPSDALLGVLVIISIAMIAIGYLPSFKKWRGQHWVTRSMNVAVIAFVVYAAFLLTPNT